MFLTLQNGQVDWDVLMKEACNSSLNMSAVIEEVCQYAQNPQALSLYSNLTTAVLNALVSTAVDMTLFVTGNIKILYIGDNWSASKFCCSCDYQSISHTLVYLMGIFLICFFVLQGGYKDNGSQIPQIRLIELFRILKDFALTFEKFDFQQPLDVSDLREFSDGLLHEVHTLLTSLTDLQKEW